MHKLLKNSKDYDSFVTELKYHYISKPVKYPVIIIRTQIDPEFTWTTDSFKFTRRYETEYIYLDEIQSELFDDDFEKLIK